MAKMLKDTLKTIEVYKTQNPHYEELLAILEEILILREEYRRKLTADVFPVDERLITSKIEGGLPLIDLSQGDYDLTQPREYFFDLLRIAEKRAPGETRELARKIKEGEEDFRELVLSAFYGDETAAVEDAEGEDADDTFDLIDLFLEECLRPAFERVAAKYGDVVLKSKWKEGYCPICGKEPKIGEIKEEEGRRYLFCNQCGIEWPFLRIKCPFCGNEEQQTLAYFTVEDDERYRVDVCNECKRYIKIVDFREMKEEANLDIEDITTLHLDMLATEEGYD
ncbi:MAG TPA: formate dehydrogenase accessory protein FdhE [Syntrophales bacterium]|jgi:FdhE protein|nr:formate dehydrogenase accessory protein FdhE [Syntrophales bacterium]HON23032.1 formate dehydrogenase accessory protein FdhE [Syntrophales bacterium]HOU78168.1 formate dehydrogenase accessory protein FdhE [Syntrophales bacterium]HPC33065.1 formate dehydrogenase accessory protein FdhE [Syntrophales bacterium]HQG34504.1 formate dehydrogenase accessory protein FdhE [Syntrophales bacterium]